MATTRCGLFFSGRHANAIFYGGLRNKRFNVQILEFYGAVRWRASPSNPIGVGPVGSIGKLSRRSLPPDRRRRRPAELSAGRTWANCCSSSPLTVGLQRSNTSANRKPRTRRRAGGLAAHGRPSSPRTADGGLFLPLSARRRHPLQRRLQSLRPGWRPALWGREGHAECSRGGTMSTSMACRHSPGPCENAPCPVLRLVPNYHLSAFVPLASLFHCLPSFALLPALSVGFVFLRFGLEQIRE